MAKVFYGRGLCSIDGEGGSIRGIEIRYSGAILIKDKTSDSFVINTSDDKIMIFPIGQGTLNSLFEYMGEFKITSIIVADDDSDNVYTTIERVMDYAELIETNAEDMTIKSEDLNSTYMVGSMVNKTTLQQPILQNLNTSTDSENMYLNGSLYSGPFHVHIQTGKIMTGKTHTNDSQELRRK